jgi:ribosomal protein S18 acetylase RimI-like enzyme
MQVREYELVTLTADDYDGVRALWEAAGLSIRPAGRDSAEAFARQFAGGTQTVIGARAGDRRVGVVLATHDGRKGWINRLAVHPDFRRRGIGQALVAEAERVLRAQGMHIIGVLIEDWNTASLALFERAGYARHPDIVYLTKRDSPDV